MGYISISVGARDALASTVNQFFVSQALHLREGRIGAVARSYAVPLIVSLPNADPGFVVVSSRAGVEHFFRLKHDGLRQAGISYLRARVGKLHANTARRISARVEWYYLAEDGTRAGRTTARYFLERGHGALTVQMIEFEEVAFPALSDWFHASGRATSHPPNHNVH